MRFRPGSPLRLALLLILLAAPSQAGVVSFDLRDADGRRHAWPRTGAAPAAALLFLSPDCPFSNRYLPELARLASGYALRGVAFYAVFSDPAVGADQARRHAQEYGYPFPALLDAGQSLARQSGAAATPEAVVLSPAGQVLYRGRIDNQVEDFARRRPLATRRDLALALDQILAGRPVARPATKAIGCSIPFPRRPAEGAASFYKHVAPILYRSCAGCHRPGEAAPFPLLTYQDAARRAALIAALTSSRYMPPWKPEPGYGDFAGERRLTAAQIRTLREWAAAGAPEGNPADRPPPPRFPDQDALGAPDQIAVMSEPFPIPAGGPDLYHCFVIPLGLDRDRYLRAIEFRPRNRKLVHHALFFADPSGTARRKDQEDPGPGYRCFGGPGFLPAGGLGGWSPGSGPVTLPEGAALTLRKGSDLVLQLHFKPTGKPEEEQSAARLYFTGAAPTRRVLDIALGSRQIDIPAGERSYRVRDHFTLPVEALAIGIIPHAHYVCQEMKGFATLPSGARRWLLWIKDWDFNWQDQYRYRAPIRLPAGTRLEMEFTYDNSAGNPRNPNHPPQRVVWGAGVTDEMAGLHVQVMAERESDLAELTRALWGKFLRSVGGGFFQLERPGP